MGWGDELMAAGQAKVHFDRTGRHAVIVGRDGAPRWSPVWQGLPFIDREPHAGNDRIVNAGGARPYIDYPFTVESGQRYSKWRARDHRPAIALAAHERRRRLGVPYVYIEPTIKDGANPNKRYREWQAVVDESPDVVFVQCGPTNAGQLRGTHWLQTNTFREACGVLAEAVAFVGAEGGMHHAAAALGKPAVVVFGGSPSAEATGYPDHINFGGDDPCGRWQPCEHCRAKMASIKPQAIATALKALLLEEAIAS